MQMDVKEKLDALSLEFTPSPGRLRRQNEMSATPKW
jgi:hypothetical protein